MSELHDDPSGSDSVEDDFDRNQEIARSAFADMCHDWERNQKYDQALRLTIDRLHAAGKEAHVLDIGTGSGLLAMMSVRAGADSVTACEAFRAMADCAELVMAANGMADRIRLIKKRSTDVVVGAGKDMEHRANVLVTELFDTELIGEGAIATYRHALEHLLQPGCLVIPDKATIYAQVVECPLAMSWQVPKVLSNSDGEVLLWTPEEMIHCRGSSAVFDIQLSQLPVESFTALSEPIPVFEFDWSSRDGLELRRHSRKMAKAINSGLPQAVFMWWDLKMDREGAVLLSCAPFWAHPDFAELKTKNQDGIIPEQNLIPWRDHWMQAIYFLPHTKAPLMHGQEMALDSYHDEFSLWFGLGNTNLELAHCSCGLHIAYSRSRIGQLNEGPRNKRILNYMEQVLNADSVVLVLGDGSLLGLSFRKMGAKRVILLEKNQHSRQCMQSYVSFNKLDNVEILASLDELTPETASQISHVFGEPYFSSAILPWENGIQFRLDLEKVKALLQQKVTVVPHSFTISGVPVEFLDLHKICAPLGKCEGFDLSIMDNMIEQYSDLADPTVEAQPLWEYPCFPLGCKRDMITIELAKESFEMIESTCGPMSLSLEHVIKKCNGIALWADWYLEGSGKPNTVISTGPLHPYVETPSADRISPLRWNVNWRQGVYLLRGQVSDLRKITCYAKYSDKLKSLRFQFFLNSEGSD